MRQCGLNDKTMNSSMMKFLFLVCLLAISIDCFSQHEYSAQEKRLEEARIFKDIESKLDWHNRTKETSDDFDDEHRLLYGTLNESILLRKKSGERFGVFEAIRDNGRKSIEIRLHQKSRLTDRFQLYGDACEGAEIHAEQVNDKFIVYETACSSLDRNGLIRERFEQYLFDYASRNFYLLSFLDYDSTQNNPPSIKLEQGIYRMRWNVKLRGDKKNTLVVRNFKIFKDANGEWTVKELPPIDDEAAGIQPIKKLPIASKYDLPAYIGN